MNFNKLTNILSPNVITWANELSIDNIANIINKAYLQTNELKSVKSSDQIESHIVLASAHIGALGEERIYSILSKKYDCKNTSRNTHSGDFKITIDGINILFEVKNYTKSVPTSEVEKFFRDIDCSPSIDGGIMISLTSRITGHGKTIEHTHQSIGGRNIPIIFLNIQELKDEKTVESCIYAAVDIMSTECKSKQHHIQIGDNIHAAISNISGNLDSLSHCRNTISEGQNAINKVFLKLIQSITIAEVSIKNTIDSLRSSIHDTKLLPSNRSNKEIINDIKIQLDTKKNAMLNRILDGISIYVSDSKNIIQSENKILSIKITKTSIVINLTTKDLDITKVATINGIWTYNGKTLGIELTEYTLNHIHELIQEYVL